MREPWTKEAQRDQGVGQAQGTHISHTAWPPPRDPRGRKQRLRTWPDPALLAGSGDKP